jgi:hypothetical protein
MSRISTILNNVRIPLNDRAKERWSDEDLLLFISKAQKDITKECPILKDWVILPLSLGQSLYVLPENTVEVIECRYDGTPLRMRTHAEMDKQAVTGELIIRSQTLNVNNWETAITEDTPTTIIYDKFRRRQIRIWPTPVSQNLTVVDTDLDTFYGLVTSVDEFTMIGDFGFAGTILDTDEGIPLYENGVYGIFSEIVDQASVLIHRAKLSDDLTSVEDELQVDIICDEAIEHFVVARAFNNDQIEKNRQTAAEHLAWYNREIIKLKDNMAVNIQANEYRETSYNSMGI